MKETLLLTILNVLLPTVDIFTDLITIEKFYESTQTHENCYKTSELKTFGFAANSTDSWIDAKNKCVENNLAKGLGYRSHPIWATSLLVPFLVNYLLTWIVWWSVDKRKAISWIAPLLSVYPQVRSIFISLLLVLVK